MGNACPFQSQVGSYHDGELAGDATARTTVERHLANCATCADELTWLRRVSTTLAKSGDDGVLAPATLDRIHDAVDAEADAAEAARFDLRRLYRAAGALSAVAASILVLSCAWLNTLPDRGGSTRGNTGPTPQQVASMPEAWERVAVDLRADPVVPSGVAEGDRNLADWMLQGLNGGEVTP